VQFDPLAMQVQAEQIGLVQPLFVAIVHAFIALGSAVVESSVQIPTR